MKSEATEATHEPGRQLCVKYSNKFAFFFVRDSVQKLLTLWSVAACQSRRGRVEVCLSLQAKRCIDHFAWGPGTQPCPGCRDPAPLAARGSVPRGHQKMNRSPKGTGLRRGRKPVETRKQSSATNMAVVKNTGRCTDPRQRTNKNVEIMMCKRTRTESRRWLKYIRAETWGAALEGKFNRVKLLLKGKSMRSPAVIAGPYSLSNILSLFRQKRHQKLRVPPGCQSGQHNQSAH